jgi:hypothetical protein
MSKLFFGIVPRGTICDVFINTLVNWNENWLPACMANITSTGHLLFSNHEQYVLDLTQNNPLSFRDIDYTNRLNDIENLLSSVNGRKVWIGNFHNKQAHIIKQHFGNEVTTIGISYKKNMRELILENVVTYYSALPNELDRQKYWIEYKTRYYKDKNKWDNYVPDSFNPDTDISIDIADFFDPNNYIKAVENIDGPRNEQQLQYYFTWLFRTKERMYESF